MRPPPEDIFYREERLRLHLGVKYPGGLGGTPISRAERGTRAGEAQALQARPRVPSCEAIRAIRIRAADVRPTKSRSVQGVRLMRLEEGERLVDLARIEDPEDAASDGAVADEPQSDEPSAE